MFGNEVSSQITYKGEAQEQATTINKEHFYNLHSSQNFTAVLKSRRMRWATHVALIKKMTN
jgi:hypothetical protein